MFSSNKRIRRGFVVGIYVLYLIYRCVQLDEKGICGEVVQFVIPGDALISVLAEHYAWLFDESFVCSGGCYE